MAIVPALRVMIYLTPSAIRVAKWAEGPGVETAVVLPKKLWDRMYDPAESDEDLTAALSDATGRVSEVATYSDTFELRKVQALIGRTSGAATPEDDAVVTFHFLKLVAGSPSDTWLETDFTGMETALDTFFNVVNDYWHTTYTLRQYRWYAAGPQLDETLGGPGRTGPPRRVTDRAIAGAVSASGAQPPQIAASITEKTSDKTAWGRIYMPFSATGSAAVTSNGRLNSAVQTALGNAADALFEAARTAATPVVVYSSAKPVRETASGGSLPARGARALTVDELQIDDILDVIRSRRWNTPLLRLQRAVSA